ncbi:hypothetical protein CROQUDRAFT_105737 [Cronartium quercuum f. sp. fusiforme G11]|uniref:Uncharacterized protein n=1 Tax=Cronartium quercuum f. sp. fusiforme G11 TaxID=708437 RepID=A0A9P6TE58_9BASI|nr:hypothetical protein CROQUDRAFT_105737 [Cronartium quercuum f. sp. fusiforme G11]
MKKEKIRAVFFDARKLLDDPRVYPLLSRYSHNSQQVAICGTVEVILAVTPLVAFIAKTTKDVVI